MRLFVAVKIPEPVSEELRNIQKQLDVKGLKHVKDFHLTLKFYGEVEDSELDNIKKELSRIIFEPFQAKLSGIGVFPNEKRINVVWVGLEPQDKFSKLALQFKENEGFKPHVTLSRVKFINDKEELKDKISQLNVPELTFDVEWFYLVKSTLTKEGPVYEDLAVFPQNNSEK
ncbi:RNA 2',3'-cyclic phosphodiesterase [Candidatus Woesearchaeota archaeon]|nr:RNA 2',3'-cyclic phosphodiesterase [Candidatus Woesearchaeota archaeon]